MHRLAFRLPATANGAKNVQVLHAVSINVSTKMRSLLITPTLTAKFEDIANGRSNTLAAGLTQLLHDWEFLFR